jgi:Zn-dependent M28 family amino/carboxypeptidase
MRRLAIPMVAAAILAGCGGGGDEEPAPEPAGFDAERAFADLEAQVALGPRPSGSPAAGEAARLIASGFEQAGLTAVTTQSPWENVLATIPGTLDGTVIVGAHYDTKNSIPGFVGANDGASGVALLLELARALPRRLAGPSVQLVAFDAEEARGDRDFDADGIRGSRQYVEYARAGGEQGSVPIDQIRAAVVFDLIGDCKLQIPYESNSDRDLYTGFAVAAAELYGDPAPFESDSFPVSDDHLPFIEAGIAGVVLIDFSYGPGAPPGEYWHTAEDTLDKVCPASLEKVGETALRAIPRIR